MNSQDQARINRTLAHVRAIMMRNPTLRLGQLLECAANVEGGPYRKVKVFFLEDDEIAGRFKELTAQTTGNDLIRES